MSNYYPFSACTSGRGRDAGYPASSAQIPAGSRCTGEDFCVNLNATYGVKGQGRQHQKCQLFNLNSGGAKVRFPLTESLQIGAVIEMHITIPNTITSIAAEAEIIWMKKCPSEWKSGITFTGELSDTMLQQVVINILQLSDYTELVW